MIKMNNIKIIEKIVTGRAIISDNILWKILKETIDTADLSEDIPLDISIPMTQSSTDGETTKGLTETQKDMIKTSINKLRATLEIEEEEIQEKHKFQSRINEQINNINNEAINEEFNYKDPRQVKILLNAARIELF